ncbi:glycosylated lysosomal membrane protein A-like [Ptychodera flava]|uniref:glycosylated lysosomal membrane protein A-like n=1 Tax=Ptychodera flava TaxID=63121 RepID=UPI00396A2BD1
MTRTAKPPNMAYIVMESHRCLAIFLCVHLIISTFSLASTSERKLSIEYNPNCTIAVCKNSTDNKNLVYVKAVGNDVIHYLWSSIGAPTLVLATTPNNTKLHVNWEKLMSSGESNTAIEFVPNDVIYSMAMVFTRMFEYDDVNDTSVISKCPRCNMKSLLLEDLKWQDMNITINETTHSAVLNTTLYQPSIKGNGTISIQFTAYGEKDRSKILPHLQYTANTTQVDFTIDSLEPAFNSSRFALEVLAVSGQKNPKEDIIKQMTKSIDDEYTPGMFEVDELHLPPQPPKSKYGSYSQWKPVCYFGQARDLSNALEANSDDLQTENLYIPRESIMVKFYDMKEVDMAAFNLSFGTSKDGFYNAHHYVTWTTNVGYGTPPEDELSLLVIIVLIAGLGIPVLLIVAGGTYVCIKKRRQKYKELTLLVN